MTNTDAEGKRGEAPAPDEATTAGESAGGPLTGAASPPQRSTEHPGDGGIHDAGLGGGTGDLGGGGDVGDDLGGAPNVS
jgi:hypothetical protein